MKADANNLNWFEIPAGDINRAKKFYESIFGMEMSPVMEMMGMQMSMFPAQPGNGKATGGIAKSDMHKPAMDGALIYLNANPDMSKVLEKIDASGGKVLLPKTKISDEIGYMAFFTDTEGNKVGLHSQN